MDWKTLSTSIIASLVGSGILTSVVAYFLKKSFDRTIDLKYEQLLDKYKQELQEQTRRHGELFDQQSKAFQKLLALVYRLRNIARDLSRFATIDEVKRLIEEHHKYTQELQNELFEFRAILPESVFETIHSVKNRSSTLDSLLQARNFKSKKQTNIDTEEFVDTVKRTAVDLDGKYRLLVDLIQPRIGLIKENEG